MVVPFIKNFFESILEGLEGSAYIDGASDIKIRIKIYLPLSKAALATVSLFYAISRWNGYLWAMIILRDEKKLPLCLLGNYILSQEQRSVKETIKMAVEKEQRQPITSY